MKEIIIRQTHNWRKRAIKLSKEVVEITEEFFNPFKWQYEIYYKFYVNKEEYKALKKLFEEKTFISHQK